MKRGQLAFEFILSAVDFPDVNRNRKSNCLVFQKAFCNFLAPKS